MTAIDSKIIMIAFFILAVTLAACVGTPAATGSSTGTPVLPTASPTAVIPTPDISVYLQMDLSGGDSQHGFNAAIALECKSCHDSLSRPDRGPQFKAAEDLPPIMARGEQRISDPAYDGQATTNREYIIESIYNPRAHLVAGEWKVAMPEEFAEKIKEEDLVHLMSWLETFSEADDLPTAAPPPAATPEPQVAIEGGDPARGQDIFETGGGVLSTQCIKCHTLDGSDADGKSAGPTMLGISAVAGERVPGITAEQYLVQSILDPSAYIVEGYEDKMEKSYQWLLSEEDFAALAAFLLTLQ